MFVRKFRDLTFVGLQLISDLHFLIVFFRIIFGSFCSWSTLSPKKKFCFSSRSSCWIRLFSGFSTKHCSSSFFSRFYLLLCHYFFLNLEVPLKCQSSLLNLSYSSSEWSKTKFYCLIHSQLFADWKTHFRLARH